MIPDLDTCILHVCKLYLDIVQEIHNIKVCLGGVPIFQGLHLVLMLSVNCTYIGPAYHRYLPSKNPYPLNLKESDIFYFLLIVTKLPKRPKFQRSVSSSSKLHAIECISRDNYTLAFLLIFRQKSGTKGMIKSLGIVPSVFDLALTL